MQEAVPDIKPEPPPAPPLFTWEEYRALPMSVKAKIAKAWTRVNAYVGVMEAKLGIWQDWGNSIFSGKTPQETLTDRGKKPPPK